MADIIGPEIEKVYSYLEALSSTSALELRQDPAKQRINFPEKEGISGYQSEPTGSLVVSNGEIRITGTARRNSIGVVEEILGISIALPDNALEGWKYEGYFPKEILENATIVLERHWPADTHQLMKVNTDKGSPYIGYATSIEVPHGKHERMLVAEFSGKGDKRRMFLSFSGYVPSKEELIEVSAKIYSEACQYKGTA